MPSNDHIIYSFNFKSFPQDIAQQDNLKRQASSKQLALTITCGIKGEKDLRWHGHVTKLLRVERESNIGEQQVYKTEVNCESLSSSAQLLGETQPQSRIQL